jgi:hypothetical protein
MQVHIVPGTRKVAVDLFLDQEEKPFSSYDLAVGHLDPSDEISGIQARLANLGYYAGPISGELDETTRRAISDFCMLVIGYELDEMDDAFIEALDRAHRI